MRRSWEDRRATGTIVDDLRSLVAQEPIVSQIEAAELRHPR
jgi:hypothetical protein